MGQANASGKQPGEMADGVIEKTGNKAEAASDAEDNACDAFLFKISDAIQGSMQRFFYFLGWNIANNPWKTIIGSILLVVAMGAGFARFKSENRQDKLWVPQDSVAIIHQDFIRSNYASEMRRNMIIEEYTGGE